MTHRASEPRWRYLGHGFAFDSETEELHFFVKDALVDWGLPDTPENRVVVEEAAKKVVGEIYPNTRIEEEE